MTPTTFPSSNDTFRTAYGDFTLLRRPLTPQLPLQAWDAADEYLVAEASKNKEPDEDKESKTKSTAAEPKVLVINDQFGALAAVFSHRNTYSWNDSYTAHRATLDNFGRNHLDTTRLVLLPSTQKPIQKVDIVLWRIPKTLALLQQQASLLHTCVNDEALVLASGMQKHLPPQTLDILKQIGEIELLPTRKKARAYSLHLRRKLSPQDHDLAQPQPAKPTQAQLTENVPIPIAEYGLRLHSGPNVFARDGFDIGARFFIEQFAKLPRVERIADLGCGNGVLGIVAQQKIPTAQIEFFDESYQAIAVAEKNYRANSLRERCNDEAQTAAKFHVDDVFSNYDGEPFDLILCNPPFHQGHVVGDHIARQMFTQSRQHLRSGGELWIVGNRHLDYHIKLKKIFGNCRQIAANAKFVVLAARVNF